MWDPVAYALGFIDCDNISARCMLTIFSLFATKTEASLLRMLKGSPDVYLSGPIRKYIEERGGRYLSVKFHSFIEFLLSSITPFGKTIDCFIKLFLYYDRFHLRWGCRKVLYDRSPNGDAYVTGLAMSKVGFPFNKLLYTICNCLLLSSIQ